MKNRSRTCLGCRGKYDRELLLRVTRINGEEGKREVKFDPIVKLQGRGAWVCRKKECIEKVKKSHAFERALKAHIIDDIYDNLLCLV